MSDQAPMLTRFEVARLVGVRALEISEHGNPRVVPPTDRPVDYVLLATMELRAGLLDARVRRSSGEVVDTTKAVLPPSVQVLVDIAGV